MYEWNFGYLWQYRQLFVNGLMVTLGYSLLCIVFGLAVGLVCGMGGLAKNRLVYLPLKWYVELFRATPVLVLIIWFYYALPVLVGVAMTAQVAAVLALSLYGGAFYSEIIRGGIISIDGGQSDAARALGMTRFQVMRRVVMPQALRRMTPPLMNQSIMQLKNTSLLSVLALPDLLYQGQAVAHETYRPLEAYTLIALMYIAILLPASMLVRRLEAKRVE
ncbi:amino acid ABC transporter permease [Rhodoferax antarcticus]|uniref:Amino ABC transporter permease, 3-TM region, His/Glu/Gln/Arg/opine family domain protein n=1 Tax=Rhodoferax antarcticus ANT.BR TaxID=1111071 RepID=A0A1Q8YIQ2_9BURK|nr:amino acid ABC transporter permease [Rhodoferax antarcticus]APW48025.1 ABC transporter permease [Rhodoferax antarcticus]OLP07857.1 amino ABC transporter permease, 3-TM region, His/Glu/Gln/Arg/opine family domain protein [Rhodoferax antarcticus ANT.BR]